MRCSNNTEAPWLDGNFTTGDPPNNVLCTSSKSNFRTYCARCFSRFRTSVTVNPFRTVSTHRTEGGFDSLPAARRGVLLRGSLASRLVILRCVGFPSKLRLGSGGRRTPVPYENAVKNRMRASRNEQTDTHRKRQLTGRHASHGRRIATSQREFHRCSSVLWYRPASTGERRTIQTVPGTVSVVPLRFNPPHVRHSRWFRGAVFLQSRPSQTVSGTL